jgi:Helix-turn-helix of DDE superfamily endonuclease
VLFYRAAVDLSRSMLNYVAGLVRRQRKAIGSTWRLLNPGQQALLVLVYLRKSETFSELAAGFGVSTATAWRYVEETVLLLSARSLKLGQALRKAKKSGLHYLVLDGTLIRTDRKGRPARLLRQAPCARHERPGHRITGRHDPVDLGRVTR